MRRIAREFKAIPSRCFDGSPEIHNAITQLAREFRQPDEHSKARVAALLMDLLVSILRAAAKSSSGPLITKSTGIQQAIDYIEKHLADPEDTSRLAAEVGMKRDSFREKFQHEVGMTPAEYLLRRRIQKVQDLLRENKLSTTDIAQSVGFSSSQYLATAFKKIMAITPQAYRQRHLTSSNHQIR
jgi:transcriptional regulator GlxA family with amidase domain